MVKATSLQKADTFKDISFELDNGVLCILSKKPERSSALLDTLVGVRNACGGIVSGNVGAAYLAKGCPLPPNVTAEEYLKLVASVKKVAEIPENVRELTEGFSKSVIASLSPFERLTLGVASSLIGESSFIAIEEPYYGLSYEEYGDLKELIRTVSEEIPIIFTSSSVFECKEISEKILVMSAGSQIYFGETKALFETDINETDIYCLVKGDKETVVAALERFSPETEETVRAEIFSVTVKNVPMFKAAETRSRIKKLLTKARISLLEMKSEKEALLNIIGELTENDKKKRSEYEEAERVKVTKITGSLIAFSHDDVEEDEMEEDEYEDPESVEDEEFSKND